MQLQQSNKTNKENDGREKDGGSDTVSDVDSPSPVEDQTSVSMSVRM